MKVERVTRFSVGRQKTNVIKPIHKNASIAIGLEAAPSLKGPRLKLRG